MFAAHVGLEQASLIVIASLCPLEQSRDLPNILSPIRRSATSNDVSAHRQQIPAAACVRDREGNHHMCARQMVTTSFPGEGNCNIIRYEEERRVCLHAKTLRITNDDALISIRHVVTRNGDNCSALPSHMPPRICRLANGVTSARATMMVALQLGERIEFLVLIVVSWLLSFTISQLSHPEEEIQEEEEQGRLVRRPQAGSSLRRGNARARLTLMNERGEQSAYYAHDFNALLKTNKQRRVIVFLRARRWAPNY